MLELNHCTDEPTVLHADYNGCFASAEAQLNPQLRGRPIAVAAGTADACCVISPSYEAKAYGVKVGCRVRDAKALCPDIIILQGRSDLYRYVHERFAEILRSYSSNVKLLSIDEAVIYLKNAPALNRGIVNVAHEIRERVYKEVGEHMSINIGISTNRFLAKTAASLHKPRGTDVITHENIRDVLNTLKLTDLCGINTRMDARLRMAGINTPLEMYDAPATKLKKEVYKSVLGNAWYLKMRGWEVENVETDRKSFGQSFALHKFTTKVDELTPILMKLTHKMGNRMRSRGYYAKGVHLGVMLNKESYWHEGRLTNQNLFSTNDLYKQFLRLLGTAPLTKPVSHMMISVYDLHQKETMQMELLDSQNWEKRKKLTDSIDLCNNRYGTYTVHSAQMLHTADKVTDRISFTAARDIHELYK
jgi:DNA polymerase-4